MTENAYTVFNVYVSKFVAVIWVSLRDPRLDVWERAVEALCVLAFVLLRGMRQDGVFIG